MARLPVRWFPALAYEKAPLKMPKSDTASSATIMPMPVLRHMLPLFGDALSLGVAWPILLPPLVVPSR